MLSARDPISTSAYLTAGKQRSIWEAISATAPSATSAAEGLPLIDRDLLVGVEDKAPVRTSDQNYYESRAYHYLLIQAHKASPKVLAKNARRDLTYVHLFEEPEKYRGQLVHIQGQLRRLRALDASRLAAKEGVPILYEGWIFDDLYYANPYCVIVSELPPSIRATEKTEQQVAFDGYFFKRYRYKAGDGWRDAPLLIGRTLRELPALAAIPESPWSFSRLALPTFLLLLVLTGILVVGLSIWFRGGDRRVRSRLDLARSAGFIEPGRKE